MGSPVNIRRCDHCYVNILDDTNHTCLPHQITAIKKWVYVKQLHKMFTFKIDGEMFYLNSRNGRFELISDNQKLLSPATDGLISFEKKVDTFVASYSASTFKRFAIVFARLIRGNQWKSFMAVETTPTGLRAYNVDLNVTDTVPNELKFNTIAILGLKPKSIYMDFDVFANETGEIDERNFDGYKMSHLIANRMEIWVNFSIYPNKI